MVSNINYFQNFVYGLTSMFLYIHMYVNVNMSILNVL